MADYIYSMETRLTPDQQSGVNLVQEIARHAGLNFISPAVPFATS